MSGIGQESAAGGLGFDLSQFHEIFYEEAGENLDSLEQHLVAVDLAAADDEALNAIFRCAHSIKGGAATFGFDDIAELTHEMESLLDRLRRRELPASNAMVDLLLQSADALKAQLSRHQRGGRDAPIDTAVLLQALRSLLAGEPPAAAASAAVAPAATTPAVVAPAVVAPAVAVPAATTVASPPAIDEGFGFFDDMPDPLPAPAVIAPAATAAQAVTTRAGAPSPSGTPAAAPRIAAAGAGAAGAATGGGCGGEVGPGGNPGRGPPPRQPPPRPHPEPPPPAGPRRKQLRCGFPSRRSTSSSTWWASW